MKKAVIRKSFLLLGMLIFAVCIRTAVASAEEARTIYTSPYVSFAPDGMAWTTNAGEKGAGNGSGLHYEKGERVEFDRKSDVADLKTGQHFYRTKRTGEIPVGYWEVEWAEGQCIHNSYPGGNYHGISFGTQICFANHYSGWIAYCADCGERLTDGLIYLSREAAKSIEYIQVQDGLDYYYLCPFCDNLEQGYCPEHFCKEISYNRYRVVYDANHTGKDFADNGVLDGFMSPSIHMYNDISVFEGEKITPVTHLTLNAYQRTGYRFMGWNTEPDGSGVFFADGARILNLTTENWDGTENGKVGTVTLYAQWEQVESILRIDPNGGSYNGNTGLTVLKRPYGTYYEPDSGLLIPPDGFTCFYECNGGTVIPPTTGTMQFAGWSMIQPFLGTFREGIYTYDAPEQHVDTLQACYTVDSIVLPGPEKEGASFGGWYYDSELTLPAGGAGDLITPTKNITLYAQWVELVLESADNYSVNDGKGAVDLKLKQADGNGKSYKFYQSLDLKNWVQINASDDIGNERNVETQTEYTGASQNITVPYSGIYTLSLSGAQGGDYGSFSGGPGGSVTGRFYLSQGEVLTVTIGGQNGFNGGGKASGYGSGGGRSEISSDRKGTLLIAGGGGGATAMNDGYPGGSPMGVQSGSAGQDGASGGGGGYQGGLSGKLIYHNHTASEGEIAVLKKGEVIYLTDICLHTHEGSSAKGGGCYGKAVETSYSGTCHVSWAHTDSAVWGASDKTGCPACHGSWRCDRYDLRHQCSADNHVMTQHYYCTSGCGYSKWTNGFNNGYTHTGIFRKTIYQLNCIAADSEAGWTADRCKYGLSEHQVIAAEPAYGGSSYVNRDYALSFCMNEGEQKGDGKALITAEIIGFHDVPELAGVSAPDLKAPEPVAENGLVKASLGESKMQITWEEPEDNGTVYYHRAESYLRGFASLLCNSNVTKNTLISGIMGYYYVTDLQEDTPADASGSFTSERSLTVQLSDDVQFLHLAAVDKAGNISSTLHIQLDAESMNRKIYTGQLRIETGQNVYAAEQDKTYYVRCDGRTPFLLQHSACLDGHASQNYQINYSVFETEIMGKEQTVSQNIIYTPSGENAEIDRETEAEGLVFSVKGDTLLKQYPYAVTSRSDRGRNLDSRMKFTLDGKANGLNLRIIPRAGVDYEKNGRKEVQYSDRILDAENQITVIGDGEGPVIRGLEILQNREIINRLTESICLSITAEDKLSGVAEFWIEVKNRDNYGESVYYPENGVINLVITGKAPLFTGNFTVTAHASDNVGNRTENSFEVTEFSLETRMERILEPHTPVFKCGESGILYITTYGYADRVEVEFPEELAVLNPKLNQTIDYKRQQLYRQEAALRFMIPLYAPENQSYTVTVRAYKGDKKLEDYPSFSTIEVGGTVLGEFRTRLR